MHKEILEKFLRILWARGKIRFVQKDVKVSSAPSDLQALIQEGDCFADEDGELHLRQDQVDFKGKDGHDTDGSLSLGEGKASGRVDVPFGVNAFLSAETFCRSGQSVAVVTPGSCVVKTIFVKGVDGDTVVRRAERHTGKLRGGCRFYLNRRMLDLRGRDTVRITKVKGHADEVMVLDGRVRELDRLGNNAADFGRRRVGPVVIDARRNLSGV